eukprot:m51a1_g12260 hypothetical protein (294) ;mRNA; f:179086-180480
MSSASPPLNRVQVVLFQLSHHVDYGDCRVFLSGESQELGGWDIARAVRMHWTPGDRWTAHVEFTERQSDLHYKYLVGPFGPASAERPHRWEPTSDRHVFLPIECEENNVVFSLHDQWGVWNQQVDVIEAFMGTEALLREHYAQMRKFAEWEQQRSWRTFHVEHYDWWAFPISEQSRYGFRYSPTAQARQKLRGDPQFLSSLEKAVELMCRSWGWDLWNERTIAEPHAEQCWRNNPIRLYKAGRSLQEFRRDDAFAKLCAYARHLESSGARLKFHNDRCGDQTVRKHWECPLSF